MPCNFFLLAGHDILGKGTAVNRFCVVLRYGGRGHVLEFYDQAPAFGEAVPH